MSTELTADEALDRLRTVVDEGIGMQPVLGWEDLLTLVERHMFTQRLEIQRLSGTIEATALHLQNRSHIIGNAELAEQLAAALTGSVTDGQ